MILITYERMSWRKSIFACDYNIIPDVFELTANIYYIHKSQNLPSNTYIICQNKKKTKVSLTILTSSLGKKGDLLYSNVLQKQSRERDNISLKTYNFGIHYV